MKVKSESEVAQSCLTLNDPMDCSLPGSSTHGIFQARVLEWGAIAFSARKRQDPSKGGHHQGKSRPNLARTSVFQEKVEVKGFSVKPPGF